MKQLIFSALSLVAATAWAQAPAKEAAKPATEASKEKQVKQASATPRKPRRWHEDARHCLELQTNIEVIKCAEEYL